MQTLSEIRALLAERGLRPKHRLGQNFLHDKNQLQRLVAAATIARGDCVLEVGPGTGTLTEELLEAGANIIACELDDDMASIIEDRFAAAIATGQLRIVRGDALGKQRELNRQIVDLLADNSFKLVANLPYQIASPLMTTLLIDHPRCVGQFVTIQKEVADRLMAKPSTKAYGPLTVIAQAFGNVGRIGTLGPGCFWPEPEVVSAMVSITPKARDRVEFAGDARGFARYVTELFSKRRKQLGTVFGRSHPAWPLLAIRGVAPDARSESLHVEQLITLWTHTRETRAERIGIHRAACPGAPDQNSAKPNEAPML